ncbi:aminotransferase [Herbiconiux sp. VKM Ac-2851]|uniref:aminotransferase n=1 Tax=Herbiconiux sp. VKM Ac-2851 TaxID=2739025 RepID=UPI001566F5FF|nr:aminotransferase [Herbiconiux sp. VKM Ac-2851]NQX34648.1 aminotransferase [Herbiconiux sp. VKM Ac-2851]
MHQPSAPRRSFAETVTAAPAVSEAQAAEIAAEVFGLAREGLEVTSLGSQTDANFRLRPAPSAAPLLLKVANPSTSLAELEAQSAAADAVRASPGDVATPRTHPALTGERVGTAVVDGAGLPVRLLDFLEGSTLSGPGYLAPSVVARLGTLAARSVQALAAFAHPGTDRDLEWDLRNARHLVDDLLPFADAATARSLRASMDAVWPVVERLDPGLRRQVIHGDITDDNVVAQRDEAGRLQPFGIIDFGDVMHSWRIAELAVTCSSVLHHSDATVLSVLPAVTAFHALVPLEAAEVDALWPLVVARAATLVASAHHAAAIDPGNEYTAANAAHEHRILEVATSVPAPVFTAALRAALGLPAPALSVPAAASPLLPGLVGRPLATLDLSTTSPALARGRFLDPDAERTLAVEALAGGALSRGVLGGGVLTGGVAAAVLRFGERRLTRTRLDDPHAPTAALGVELHLAEPQPVHAPWPGDVTVDGERMLLRTPTATLELTGLTPAAPTAVTAGELLGTATTHLTIRVLHPAADPVITPSFATPELAEAWGTLVGNPTSLLPDAPPRASATPHGGEGLLARREQSLAEVQEHYYAHPPQIERGWRHHLVDTEARAYLDMVNNVASVGHAHPRIADAVSAQLELLNTNSRFNYASIVEFSERLAGLLPDPLDTVFLVNSGSEAVDLALRIAWARAGHQHTVALREAYHGWTFASDAVSTSVADNPGALESRPPWIHALDTPNSYRGRHRGADAARYAPEAVALIEELASDGHAPAAFIAEPFYGNAGGLPLPDGYLRAVYPAVRAAGGLCVADEVQVGYGRLGEHFWGFEQQGVVPDIVTVAKAAGNGHPLGAVITTRAIADAYRSQGYFFSSAGGSPVSSVVGLAVLEIIRDEGLQENARAVGAHLKARLQALGERHALIGGVHGLGLYLGVEFVRDRVTLEPAPLETAAVCERMLTRGIIVQPTSDRQNVLKIKPPLTLTVADADRFADELDHVLTTGW